METTEDIMADEILDPEKVKLELIAKYPTKVARKRAKQIVINKVGEAGDDPLLLDILTAYQVLERVAPSTGAVGERGRPRLRFVGFLLPQAGCRQDGEEESARGKRSGGSSSHWFPSPISWAWPGRAF